MKKKQKRAVQIIAIVLAALLAAGAVVSAVLSLAYAEEAASSAPVQCTLKMEYLAEEQALRISQRLLYVNTSDTALDRLIFYAPANMFRRESALMYDAESIEAAFSYGYTPGGIELLSVRADDEAADYGFQGEDEIYLRVACNIPAGESRAIEFEYYLLFTETNAFLGCGTLDIRLSDFCFIPARLDSENQDFALHAPLHFTRYIDSPKMDVLAEITLPDTFALAGTGVEQAEDAGAHARLWRIDAKNVHDFALSFGRRWREYARETASGVQIRCLLNARGTANTVLNMAEDAVNTLEMWFGPLPSGQIDIVQSDYGVGALAHTGCLWLNEETLSDRTKLRREIYYFFAQQYFGRSAYAEPSADAWLSDAISEYLSYLILEEIDGHDAYLRALNENIVPALQLTIPGGVNVASDAALFDETEYRIVIRDRGAAVFHELRTAMGHDELLAGLRRFYELGQQRDVLTEMDLLHSLNDASGRDWENFLTDWVFNIGDYVNQQIDFLD